MTGKTLPQNPAARDDDGAVDGTPAADADDSPCAVEIASAANPAAASRGMTRLLGPRLAASCRPRGFNRPRRFACTGYRLVDIADAAAGTPRLRMRHARQSDNGKRDRLQRRFDKISNNVLHHTKVSNEQDPGGPDPSAPTASILRQRFAGLAALVKRFVLRHLDQPRISRYRTSDSGAFRTCRNVRLEPEMRTKADVGRPLWVWDFIGHHRERRAAFSNKLAFAADDLDSRVENFAQVGRAARRGAIPFRRAAARPA